MIRTYNGFIYTNIFKNTQIYNSLKFYTGE